MEKIKSFIKSSPGKDLLTVVIIILVGLASFGLGRLSTKPQKGVFRVSDGGVEVDKGMSIKKPSLGEFFGSKRGSKYYSIDCASTDTIKPENLVYFQTREEAEGAGYELSSSCR